MLWSIFGVITLSFGIWALSQGRLKLSNEFVLEGNQARIAGIVLVIAPIIGAIFSLSGQGDASYIFGSSCYGIIGVLAFAAFQAWKSKRSPQIKAQIKSEPAVSRKRNPAHSQAPRTQPASSSNSRKRRMPDSSAKAQSEQEEEPSKDQIEPNLSVITTCPNCGMRVLPRSDGTCPSCQARIPA